VKQSLRFQVSLWSLVHHHFRLFGFKYIWDGSQDFYCQTRPFQLHLSQTFTIRPDRFKRHPPFPNAHCLASAFPIGPLVPTFLYSAFKSLRIFWSTQVLATVACGIFDSPIIPRSLHSNRSVEVFPAKTIPNPGWSWSPPSFSSTCRQKRLLGAPLAGSTSPHLGTCGDDPPAEKQLTSIYMCFLHRLPLLVAPRPSTSWRFRYSHDWQ
jgi:hypothetical protein